MRLFVALGSLLFLSLPVGAQSQTAVPKAKSVEKIEDIEIGMSADQVIAGLTKGGYTLRNETKGETALFAVWEVSYGGKSAGEFTISDGRVITAQMSIYNNQKGDAIGLAEALYWIFYDNGRTVASQDRDTKLSATSAQFTTKEIEERTPGSSLRMIFATMPNGASYRILLMRPSGSVWVDKLAPFMKTK